MQKAVCRVSKTLRRMAIYVRLCCIGYFDCLQHPYNLQEVVRPTRKRKNSGLWDIRDISMVYCHSGKSESRRMTGER